MNKVIEQTNELLRVLLNHDEARANGMVGLGSYSRCTVCRDFSRRLDLAADELP